MTVQDLIDALSKENPTDPVRIWDADYREFTNDFKVVGKSSKRGWIHDDPKSIYLQVTYTRDAN